MSIVINDVYNEIVEEKGEETEKHTVYVNKRKQNAVCNNISTLPCKHVYLFQTSHYCKHILHLLLHNFLVSLKMYCVSIQ